MKISTPVIIYSIRHAESRQRPSSLQKSMPPAWPPQTGKLFRWLTCVIVLMAINSTSLLAQNNLPPEVRSKLLNAYKAISKPEISFEKYAALNSHIYTGANQRVSNAVTTNPSTNALAIQDPYCTKVRAYCSNGDFETGLDQNQYIGAYGTWSANLYPNPFTLTYGFTSGSVNSSAAHHTIVNKSAGNDIASGIPLVPTNGGNQSLRLGNAVNGTGTEIIAKTIVVDPTETILGFYYALVLQDPGHSNADQPAFSVRVYDCASGLEIPNVCDLGNGSNIAVANAGNPFFKNRLYQSETLVYRDWSFTQINLSNHVGKTVTIVFTVKDCNLSGHFGYAYLDNLFSGQCPAPPDGGTVSQGTVRLDPAKVDSCGTGQLCVKYNLPFVVNNTITTTGDATISLNVYQNNALVRNIVSPKLTTYNTDSSYCFNVDPATLGINTALGGFDYSITGQFTLSGFVLPSVIIGNPPAGQKAGVNNDYLVVCSSGCNLRAGTTVVNSTNNGANGMVTITANGGTPPYTYTLDAVTNATGIFTGLMPGTYNYSVTDNGTCNVTGTVVVTNTVPGTGSASCPPDSIIVISGTNCNTVINWRIPSAMFPASIPVAGGINLAAGTLTLKGVYNGHGYYQSDDNYSWPDAKAAAEAVNGHLVTITDAGESGFIKTSLPQNFSPYGSWIGLFNTGTPGSFAWVTGEPVAYTDWNYAEPNNYNGDATNINEPYVHILGVAPTDTWNDLNNSQPLHFIAEYDNPVLTYTQTSGPAPGSTVTPGVYRICYEITNLATGVKTTCCFNITVVCNSNPLACPADTTIVASSADCSTPVQWTIPAGYPATIAVAGGINLAAGTLTLKGVYNGHGYYQSDDNYSWPDAKAAAEAVNGHLVTITDAGESGFIKTSLPQNFSPYGSWIGLFNTGTPGSFAWVTGEPVAYTDWNYAEPNNYNGDATNINEPYVHILGVAPTDTWNDLNNSQPLHFIAEYDNPVLTYTQIAGIPYGSTQAPGVYPVCYEITNTITGVKTTCCFNVTVTCGPSPAPARTQAANSRQGVDNGAAAGLAATKAIVPVTTKLAARLYPNPSIARTAFSVRTESSNSSEPLVIKVYDMMGRITETRAFVPANTTVTMGGNYRPGMYLVQVTQGKNTVSLKLIKQ